MGTASHTGRGEAAVPKTRARRVARPRAGRDTDRSRTATRRRLAHQPRLSEDPTLPPTTARRLVRPLLIAGLAALALAPSASAGPNCRVPNPPPICIDGPPEPAPPPPLPIFDLKVMAWNIG